MTRIIILSFLTISTAFLVPTRRSFRRMTLNEGTTDDRVRKAGAGLPTVPSGGRKLFDPATEGKLGEIINERIAQGSQFRYLAAEPAAQVEDLEEAQHWLEDIGLPLNTVKPTAPVQATVLGRIRVISEDAPGDIEHVVLQVPEGFHYVEGQSLTVIPPGNDPKTGKRHKPRLYSIASTRYGDLLDGRTVSLCVRRAQYVDPATGTVDPTKAGVCSNYLCDVQTGEVVDVAGPVGKTMLLPEDPSRDIIMVATGTGIAPFRGFLQRLFLENTVAGHMFAGHAWLILGVPTTGGILYPGELEIMKQVAQKKTHGTLEVTYAISREQTNKQGGKKYVQDVLKERASELFDRLDKGAVIYFCGLKGMMPGILEALEAVSAERGRDWKDMLAQLKANDQWHVEVY